ncbi:MAG TPA: AraC family transcriptional regulator [Blastocatellia bacterium]|nr:AraC family transcriptional regulator [Blastocatellia bacterium]
MSALVRATALVGYQELVSKLGYEPTGLLRRYHIAPDLPGREEGVLPYRSLMQLLETSARELACPDFGLQLAEYQGLDILGPIALIARHSDTVVEAIEAISQYFYFHCPASTVCLDCSDPAAPFVSYTITLTSPPPMRQAHELAMGVGRNILHLLLGTGYAPQAVLFAHDTPVPLARYRSFFNTEVRFAQPYNAFLLRPEDLRRPLAQKDAYLKRVFTDYLTRIAVAPSLSLQQQVTALIRRLLPTGHCTINLVAEQMCLHRRTLQRRLTDAGVSFEQLVGDARRESVQAYLTNSSLPLTQLAGLAGYAEQSSLNRACQRWFGQSPRRYRASRFDDYASPGEFPAGKN